MAAEWYQDLFQLTRFATRRSAVHDFKTTAKGSRLATSVGGVLTGRGADFIIIDDPLKPDEAISETHRYAVNNWYANTLVKDTESTSRGSGRVQLCRPLPAGSSSLGRRIGESGVV